MCYYCRHEKCKECVVRNCNGDITLDYCDKLETCEMLSTLAAVFYACPKCYSDMDKQINRL